MYWCVISINMRRREFCERAVAAGAAVTGASAVAGTAIAHPGSIPVVTTRGHFDVSWQWDFWNGGFYDEELVDGHTKYDYDVSGEIPRGVDELVVVVHGWSNDPSGAAEMFETTREGLRSGGYEGPVVGFSYDAEVDFRRIWQVGKWWAHYRVAKRNGLKLASFLRNYATSNRGTTIRLVGHSLGAQPMVNALRALDVTDTGVATVSNLGGAVEEDAVSTAGQYGGYIERNCGAFHNYHKGDDLVLDTAYEIAEADAAAGEEGCDGPEPANYTDHDVSDTVGSHFEYNEPSGCMNQVVEDW